MTDLINIALVTVMVASSVTTAISNQSTAAASANDTMPTTVKPLICHSNTTHFLLPSHFVALFRKAVSTKYQIPITVI